MRKDERISAFRKDLLKALEEIDRNAYWEDAATDQVIYLVAQYRLEKLLSDYKIVEKREARGTVRYLEKNNVPLRREEYCDILS